MSFISRVSDFVKNDFSEETYLHKKKVSTTKSSIINNTPAYSNPYQTSTDEEENILFIKVGNFLKRVFFREILFFGTDGKYAYLRMERKELVVSLSLKELEQKLNGEVFVRIHQSYLVNIKKIEAINMIKNIVIINGDQLPIGRSYKKRFLAKIQFI